MPTDLYDVLGVPADASQEEVKRAYRRRVREYHPDVNDHPEGDAQFKLIRTANDVLADPAERKDYDRMGHREYAEKRLDDLPPFSVFPEFEDAGTGGSDRETESTTTGTSSAETTASSAGGGTAQTSTGSSRSGRSDRTRQSSSSGSGSTDTTASSSTASGASGTTAAHSSETTGSQSTGSQSTTADAETSESSQWSDLSGEAARRNADESATPAGVRRRRGLRRWYGVVLVALLTYVGGTAAYLLTNRGSALGLLADLQTAPVQTLVGTVPLQSPTAYLLAVAETAAAGTPTLGLLLLAGTALLPLVVLTAVAQYGHGSAWAYALASLGPAVTLAAFPSVAMPLAVVLVGLVVLPLVSGVGFLVDVGRYLLATR